MATDAQATAEFYGTRQGAVAGRLLRQRLALLWPDLRGQSLLGIGHPFPTMRLWRDQARRCVAVTPAQTGPHRWPAHHPSLSCTAEEDALPFADMSFDRVLLLHGLETAENARRLLREVWRVLKDDGRVLVVAPNRAGLWAHLERTPFGQGRPYSPGQIDRLLTASMFHVERRDTALYMPPASLRLILRAAPMWERAGRRLAPGLAGVTLTEAVKDLYAAIPAQAVPVKRRRLAETMVGVR